MSAHPTFPAVPPRAEEFPPPGEHYWTKASRRLRHRLTEAVPNDVLKELHRKSATRHFAIAARQFLLLAGAGVVSWLRP